MLARVGSKSLLALALMGLAAGACEKQPAPEDQVTGSITAEDARAARAGWPPAAGAHLDSGNAAYSAKNYQEALRHYNAIIELPDAPQSVKVPAYFGVYMTQNALGDKEAARAAADKVQELSPGSELMHGNPMTGDTARPMPPNDSIHRGVGG